MDVELRHLRAFVAVARSSSFTRASEQLLITQPALTRTVQKLENSLQVTLLDRTSRHVELTAEGREFLGHVERVLADLDVALASVRTQVMIRLGFSWLLPDPWAQRTVSRFEQATGVVVSLVRSDDPLAEVEQATIDVALIRGAIPDRSPVRRVHLFDEVRVAVCSEHSPLASYERLESVAADRGIGVVPDVAMRRNIHSAVRFIPLVNAPPSPVSLAFLPRGHQSLMRQFVEAAVAAAPGWER